MRVSPWLRYHTEVFPTLTDALARVRALSPSSVYLCGGINGLGDSACKDWRQTASQALPGVSVLDPMARDYRGREDECVDDIVEGDRRDVMASEVVLVNACRPSWGTAMEIMFAWVLRFALIRWFFVGFFRARCVTRKGVVAFMEER